jgi:hypothetical protein
VRARMLRSPLWPASLLVGLCVLTASCGASTPARAVPSPTPTPLPSPTATVSPTATAAPLANVECDALNSIPYVHLPGPLPTTIPVPPAQLSFSMVLVTRGTLRIITAVPPKRPMPPLRRIWMPPFRPRGGGDRVSTPVMLLRTTGTKASTGLTFCSACPIRLMIRINGH